MEGFTRLCVVGWYSYTREKDVSSHFGDMVSFWYIWCCFISTPCERPPFLYIFYDSLDLCKPSENKSSKISYMYCIIDRAGHETPPYNYYILSPLNRCPFTKEDNTTRTQTLARAYNQLRWGELTGIASRRNINEILSGVINPCRGTPIPGGGIVPYSTVLYNRTRSISNTTPLHKPETN
jgi:hypothetical protein